MRINRDRSIAAPTDTGPTNPQLNKAKRSLDGAVNMARLMASMPIAGAALGAGVSVIGGPAGAGAGAVGAILGFAGGLAASPLVAGMGIFRLLKAGAHLLAAPFSAASVSSAHGARTLFSDK